MFEGSPDPAVPPRCDTEESGQSPPLGTHLLHGCESTFVSRCANWCCYGLQPGGTVPRPRGVLPPCGRQMGSTARREPTWPPPRPSRHAHAASTSSANRPTAPQLSAAQWPQACEGCTRAHGWPVARHTRMPHCGTIPFPPSATWKRPGTAPLLCNKAHRTL